MKTNFDFGEAPIEYFLIGIRSLDRRQQVHVVRHRRLKQRTLHCQRIGMKARKLVFSVTDVGAFLFMAARAREMSVAEAEVREKFGFRVRKLRYFVDRDAEFEDRGGAVHAQLAGADADDVSLQGGCGKQQE